MNDDRGLIVNRADDYLEARAAPPLVIPDDLNHDAIHDMLVIPNVPQSAHSARYPNDAPRPEAIYARDEAQGEVVLPAMTVAALNELLRSLIERGALVASVAPVHSSLEQQFREAVGERISEAGESS